MTQRRRLTDVGIRALKAATAYREVVDVSGLRLAIYESGAKSFLTRYRRPTSKASAKLVHGKFPALSLGAARVAHAQALAAVAAGTDPGESKRAAKISAQEAEAARRGDTIAKHAQAFLDWQAKRLRPAGWEQQRHVIRDFMLPVWGGKSVHDIRKRDVIELVEGIAQDRPIMANRTLTVVGRFYRWLRERDVVTFSPADGVRKPSVERSRDRVLSPAEIKALWHALDTVGGPACMAAKLMLYTGQRRSECAGIRFDELDGNVWSLPKERTKNGRPHSITLSRQALAVIEQQPRISDSDYVFTAGSKPVANFSRVKLAVDRVMKPECPWCWHDTRRTAASGMQRLGVRAEVIERALNHVSGVYRSVAGVYQVDPLTEDVRDALSRWGDFVERTVKGESGGKIVKLRT